MFHREIIFESGSGSFFNFLEAGSRSHRGMIFESGSGSFFNFLEAGSRSHRGMIFESGSGSFFNFREAGPQVPSRDVIRVLVEELFYLTFPD